MTRVVQLFAKYQNKIGSLLPEILGLLNSCVTQGNLELAKIGIEVTENYESLVST